MQHPENASLEYAIELYRQGQFHDSGRALEAILNADPQNADAIFVMGLYQWRFANAALGIKFIKKAIFLKPELELFDHHRERMIQQRYTTMDAWEHMYWEYLHFQKVDSFLISYPKCGRTWLRAMLGWYVTDLSDGNPMEVFDLTYQKPDFLNTDVTHDDYPHMKPTGTLFKNKRAYKDKKGNCPGS